MIICGIFIAGTDVLLLHSAKCPIAMACAVWARVAKSQCFHVGQVNGALFLAEKKRLIFAKAVCSRLLLVIIRYVLFVAGTDVLLLYSAKCPITCIDKRLL